METPRERRRRRRCEFRSSVGLSVVIEKITTENTEVHRGPTSQSPSNCRPRDAGCSTRAAEFTE